MNSVLGEEEPEPGRPGYMDWNKTDENQEAVGQRPAAMVGDAYLADVAGTFGD